MFDTGMCNSGYSKTFMVYGIRNGGNIGYLPVFMARGTDNTAYPGISLPDCVVLKAGLYRPQRNDVWPGGNYRPVL